jgi:hypothetical protein
MRAGEMASFGAMPVVEPSGPLVSGGIFYLNRPSPRDASHIIDGRWTVQVREGSQSVVARGGAAACYKDALLQALSMAQRGLDLFSILGAADLAITEAENEHIAWWIELGSLVLRIHENYYTGFQISGTATATDPSGKPLPSPPPPKHAWHESYRYFRLSQTTDDLYDAYRNLFLALESILSTIEPVKPKASGRGWETERDRLKRAIQKAAGMVDLKRFVPVGTADPQDYLIKDLYEDKRTALFHAKKNRAVFLPQESAGERISVTSSLSRLADFYLMLVDAHLKVRRRRSSLAQDVFEGMAQVLTGLAVTDEEEDLMEDDEIVNMEGRRLVPLSCRWATELDEPYTKNLLGSLAVLPMGDPKVINQIVALGRNGVPGGVGRLKETLTLDGIDRVEAQLSIRLRNNEAKKFSDSTGLQVWGF